jgi:hypothetical protein
MLFSDIWNGVFRSKNSVALTQEAKTVWRNNMWVMSPDGIGIIFKLEEPVTVHLVNSDGVTIKEQQYQSSRLRIAKFEEIPACRRCSYDRAVQLGYV